MTVKKALGLWVPLVAVLAFVWQVSAAPAAPTATTTHSTFWGGALAECDYNEVFSRLSCVTAVDNQGNLYLAGQTDSFDIPLLNQIYDPCGLDVGADTTACLNRNEGNTAFIAKFNADLVPQFVTYFPAESVRDIAVDDAGDIYFVGSASAPRAEDYPEGFPVTSDAAQTDCGRDEFLNNCTADGYLAQLSSDGQTLHYATYLGGTAEDLTLAVAVKGDMVAVGGYTNSEDLPTTAGVFRPTYNGGSEDGFVVVFDFEGASPSVSYTTYLGDTGTDRVTAVGIDSSDRVVAVGNTSSTNFPVQNPIELCDSDLSNFCWDGFAVKLNAAGSSLIYSTFLSGGNVEVRDVVVDAQDRVYLAGFGHRESYAFVTRMNSAGTAWDYTADLGNDIFDIATAVAVDDNGIAYVAGIRTVGEGTDEHTNAFVSTVSNRGNVLD
ncbi:MAG: hypothetical protein KDD89_13555, partial [Anaerolineales bacterium]|nr:hypothetical protein [Anaerolineales bacterium]